MHKIIWLTGLPCSGKTTIARLLASVCDGEILDGDDIRKLLHNNDFSKEGRAKHVATVAELASRLSKYTDVIVALVSPDKSVRDALKNKYPNINEVYIKCSIEECIRRDVKGMYKKALAGEINDFTGVQSTYEPPTNALVVDTENQSVEASVQIITESLFQKEKYSLFIGRYQPLHDGHKTLIQKVIEEGKQVCVALRDTPLSDSNPYTVRERREMFEKEFGNKIKIIVIPDIEDVCYGRDVGWGIREIRLTKELEDISATKIRAAMSQEQNSDREN